MTSDPQCQRPCTGAPGTWNIRPGHVGSPTWPRRSRDLEAKATPLGVPSPGSTAWHANLFQKLLPQVTEAPYLIVAVAGGTNIGKSTVFNHLVGFPASQVHPDATQTKHPVCLFPAGFFPPS